MNGKKFLWLVLGMTAIVIAFALSAPVVAHDSGSPAPIRTALAPVEPVAGFPAEAWGEVELRQGHCGVYFDYFFDPLVVVEMTDGVHTTSFTYELPWNNGTEFVEFPAEFGETVEVTVTAYHNQRVIGSDSGTFSNDCASPPPTDTPEPTEEPEFEWETDQAFSCSGINASIHNLNDRSFTAKGWREFDGEVVPGSEHTWTVPPGGWANEGYDPTGHTDVHIKVVVQVLDNSNVLIEHSSGGDVDCPVVPTDTPTPSPTPTETPTEVPIEECDKADFTVVIEGNSATFRNSKGARCVVVLAVYNTHGFPNLQAPGAYQTLIGYSAGWIEPHGSLTLTVSEYDPEEGCYVQIDAMVVGSMEEVPAVVPTTLTNENQGPQWNALIRAETHGDHVCDEEPSDGMPVCPNCPSNRVDENDHPVTDVKVVNVAVDQCRVIWDPIKKKWCLNLDSNDTHVLRAWRQGAAFNLQVPGEAWIAETFTGADGKEYSTLRKVAPSRWDFIYWDGEDPGVKRLRDDHTEVHEYWGPCSITVSYHDTELIDGVAYGYWWEGHNTWEWAKFLMEEGYFDNWAGAEAWAKQLRLQGIGGRLKLPEKSTTSDQVEEADYSSSPDGAFTAEVVEGNIAISYDGEVVNEFALDNEAVAEEVWWLSGWEILVLTKDGKLIITDRLHYPERDLGVEEVQAILGQYVDPETGFEYIDFVDDDWVEWRVSVHGASLNLVEIGQ